MVTVYLWGQFDKTGHVSISFASRYCSWHPRDENILVRDVFQTPGEFREYAQDMKKNPSGPSYKIPIKGLDEHEMENEYEKIKHDARMGGRQYSLFGDNCSRVAAELISHGAGTKLTLFKHIEVILHRVRDRNSKRVPYNLPDLAEEGLNNYTMVASANSNISRVIKRSRALQALLALPLLTEALTWTPRDVVELARLYNEHH